MAAFIFFKGKITNPEKFGEYAKRSEPTLEPYQGSIILKGKSVEVLSGECDKETVGVVTFPDIELALAWYKSEAYQSLVPLRDESAKVSAVCYQVPPG